MPSNTELNKRVNLLFVIPSPWDILQATPAGFQLRRILSLINYTCCAAGTIYSLDAASIYEHLSSFTWCKRHDILQIYTIYSSL